MQRFDADNDGKLTKAEVTTGLDQLFARFDTNKDGVITQEEVKAAKPGRDGARPGMSGRRGPEPKR